MDISRDEITLDISMDEISVNISRDEICNCEYLKG